MLNSPLISLLGMTFNVYGIILLVLAIIFIFAYRDAAAKHGLNWTDMITRDGDKVSFSKILQMVGGVVGTWIVVQTTLAGTLTWDIFGIYLAYVASVDSFSKFITAKYSNGNSSDYSYSRGRSSYSTKPTRADKDLDDLIDDRPAASAKTPGADD